MSNFYFQHLWQYCFHVTINRKISCPSVLATRYAPICRPMLEESTRNHCVRVQVRAGARWSGTTKMDIQSLKDQTNTRYLMVFYLSLFFLFRRGKMSQRSHFSCSSITLHLWFATHVVSFVVTATHPAQCPCKEPRTSVGWYSQKICRISGLDWQTCTKFVRLLRDFCTRLLIVVFSWKDVVNLKTINNPHKLNTQFRKGLIHPGKLKASENH